MVQVLILGIGDLTQLCYCFKRSFSSMFCRQRLGFSFFLEIEREWEGKSVSRGSIFYVDFPAICFEQLVIKSMVYSIFFDVH